MSRMVWPRRPRGGAVGLLAVALAVECIDELVDGAKGAALPLIRHDLALSYAQVGLIFAAPLVLGSLLELPIGVAAGYGRSRRRAVAVGGGGFVAALVLAASARSFVVLLIGLVGFFPASGAFVGLTQAELMDSEANRREQHMAAWTVAGSLGAIAGPVLVVVALAWGGTWRAAFLVAAGAAAVALVGRVRARPTAAGTEDPAPGARRPVPSWSPWGARRS